MIDIVLGIRLRNNSIPVDSCVGDPFKSIIRAALILVMFEIRFFLRIVTPNYTFAILHTVFAVLRLNLTTYSASLRMCNTISPQNNKYHKTSHIFDYDVI